METISYYYYYFRSNLPFPSLQGRQSESQSDLFRFPTALSLKCVFQVAWPLLDFHYLEGVIIMSRLFFAHRNFRSPRCFVCPLSRTLKKHLRVGVPLYKLLHHCREQTFLQRFDGQEWQNPYFISALNWSKESLQKRRSWNFGNSMHDSYSGCYSFPHLHCCSLKNSCSNYQGCKPNYRPLFQVISPLANVQAIWESCDAHSFDVSYVLLRRLALTRTQLLLLLHKRELYFHLSNHRIHSRLDQLQIASP